MTNWDETIWLSEMRPRGGAVVSLIRRVAAQRYINRPKDSDFDLPGSRERQRAVIRPLAGARGYRKVQTSKDVGISFFAE
jgi:hypothetical protein